MDELQTRAAILLDVPVHAVTVERGPALGIVRITVQESVKRRALHYACTALQREVPPPWHVVVEALY